MADIASEAEPQPRRRHRTYPRVVKRARHNSYRVKKTRRQRHPPRRPGHDRPGQPRKTSASQHDQNWLSGIGSGPAPGRSILEWIRHGQRVMATLPVTSPSGSSARPDTPRSPPRSGKSNMTPACSWPSSACKTTHDQEQGLCGSPWRQPAAYCHHQPHVLAAVGGVYPSCFRSTWNAFGLVGSAPASPAAPGSGCRHGVNCLSD